MIRKTSETRPLAGHIANDYDDSQNSAYATAYVNAMNTYFTDEVNTGKKWIDDKPIYRKVLSGTTPTTSGSLLYSSNSIENIIHSYGWVQTQSTTTTKMPVNSYSNNGEYNNIILKSDGIYFNGNYVLGTSYEIVIEYTKTTD